MGYTSGYTNVGNIRNTGVEVELKTENLLEKVYMDQGHTYMVRPLKMNRRMQNDSHVNVVH